jgi:hypothetical protein
VRITKIKAPTLSENQKVRAQGASAAYCRTKIVAPAIAKVATHELLAEITAPTIKSDQIHQVSGCNDFI